MRVLIFRVLHCSCLSGLRSLTEAEPEIPLHIRLVNSLVESSLKGACGVPLKLRRKYFVVSTSYLDKHESLCLYSSLNVANHTEGI